MTLHDIRISIFLLRTRRIVFEDGECGLQNELPIISPSPRRRRLNEIDCSLHKHEHGHRLSLFETCVFARVGVCFRRWRFPNHAKQVCSQTQVWETLMQQQAMQQNQIILCNFLIGCLSSCVATNIAMGETKPMMQGIVAVHEQAPVR